MPQIIVTIDTDASVEVKAQGVTGAGCKALTSAIEKAIGQTTGDKPTSEMHASQHQTAKAGAR